MLGSLDGDACLALPSPFDKSQLDARILPVDLRYAARESSAPLVADAIETQLTAHDGNAIVFFRRMRIWRRSARCWRRGTCPARR